MNSRQSWIRAPWTAAVIVSLLAFTAAAHALTIGSNGAVSRQASVVFPTGSNTILGFTWMTSGFTLTDAATTVSWDAIFPISGDISLNGGTLNLATNIELASDARILGSGTIGLGGKTMLLGGDWSVNGAIAFSGGSGVIDGCGHAVTLSDTGTLTVGPNQSVRLRNMSIRGLAAGRVALADNTCSLILENVELNLDSSYSLTLGTLSTAGSVVIRGAAGAAFNIAGGTFRIQSHAICRVDLETALSYASTSYNKLQLVFEDATARLVIDGGKLLVITNLQLLKGQLVFQKKAAIQISTGQSLEIGDNVVVSSNLDLIIAPDAEVTSNGIITNRNIYLGM